VRETDMVMFAMRVGVIGKIAMELESVNAPKH
jgi:hypothetical protein